jgi:hypothetical protein
VFAAKASNKWEIPILLRARCPRIELLTADGQLLMPSSHLDLGEFQKGCLHTVVALQACNTGEVPATVSLSSDASAQMTSADGNTAVNILPGRSHSFKLAGTFKAKGHHSWTVMVHTGGLPPVRLNVSAFCGAPELVCEPRLLKFKADCRAQQDLADAVVAAKLKLRNKGDMPLEVELPADQPVKCVAGAAGIDNHNNRGGLSLTIKPREEEEVDCSLHHEWQRKSGDLQLKTKVHAKPLHSVKWELQVMAPAIAFRDDTIDFGAVPAGVERCLDLAVKNKGNVAADIAVALGPYSVPGSGGCCITLQPAGAQNAQEAPAAGEPSRFTIQPSKQLILTVKLATGSTAALPVHHILEIVCLNQPSVTEHRTIHNVTIKAKVRSSERRQQADAHTLAQPELQSEPVVQPPLHLCPLPFDTILRASQLHSTSVASRCLPAVLAALLRCDSGSVSAAAAALAATAGHEDAEVACTAAWLAANITPPDAAALSADLQLPDLGSEEKSQALAGQFSMLDGLGDWTQVSSFQVFQMLQAVVPDTFLAAYKAFATLFGNGNQNLQAAVYFTRAAFAQALQNPQQLQAMQLVAARLKDLALDEDAPQLSRALTKLCGTFSAPRLQPIRASVAFVETLLGLPSAVSSSGMLGPRASGSRSLEQLLHGIAALPGAPAVPVLLLRAAACLADRSPRWHQPDTHPLELLRTVLPADVFNAASSICSSAVEQVVLGAVDALCMAVPDQPAAASARAFVLGLESMETSAEPAAQAKAVSSMLQAAGVAPPFVSNVEGLLAAIGGSSKAVSAAVMAVVHGSCAALPTDPAGVQTAAKLAAAIARVNGFLCSARTLVMFEACSKGMSQEADLEAAAQGALQRMSSFAAGAKLISVGRLLVSGPEVTGVRAALLEVASLCVAESGLGHGTPFVQQFTAAVREVGHLLAVSRQHCGADDVVSAVCKLSSLLTGCDAFSASLLPAAMQHLSQPGAAPGTKLVAAVASALLPHAQLAAAMLSELSSVAQNVPVNPQGQAGSILEAAQVIKPGLADLCSAARGFLTGSDAEAACLRSSFNSSWELYRAAAAHCSAGEDGQADADDSLHDALAACVELEEVESSAEWHQVAERVAAALSAIWKWQARGSTRGGVSEVGAQGGSLVDAGAEAAQIVAQALALGALGMTAPRGDIKQVAAVGIFAAALAPGAWDLLVGEGLRQGAESLERNPGEPFSVVACDVHPV